MESVFMNGSIKVFLSIVVVLVLLYVLIRFRARRHTTSTSLEVMKGRFERGEITEEAYERAKQQQGRK